MRTLLAFCLFINLGIQAQTLVLFDTDFGGDADDLGALAMLNHFHNREEIDLLAVMCWNLETHAVSAIDAVNTYYGNPDIPIGLRSGELATTSWNHTQVLAENLPHDLTADQAPDATYLYRKILSEAEDQSLTLVTVGPLMNIKNLLESPADSLSELNGKELIHLKIKEFVIMGGQFPSGERREWNFDGNMPGVTQFVLGEIEVPITYLGYEIGLDIKTGEVFNELPKDTPLYLGFYHFSKYAPWLNHQFEGKIYDNSTYDQTAVLYAARSGVGEYWHRVTDGICVPDAEGRNEWKEAIGSKQSYLVLDWSLENMEKEIERFMLGNF